MSLLMEALQRAEQDEQAKQSAPAASELIDWERELDEFERANLDLIDDIADPITEEKTEDTSKTANLEKLENLENLTESDELYWEPGIFAEELTPVITPDIITAKHMPPKPQRNYIWMLLLLPLALAGYYAGEQLGAVYNLDVVVAEQPTQTPELIPEPTVVAVSTMSAPKAIITNEVLNQPEPEESNRSAKFILPEPEEPDRSAKFILPDIKTDIKTDKTDIKTDIKINRNDGLNDSYQHLQRAYQAFNRGDNKLATQLYQTVLQQEPRNREALLGLAALAQRKTQYRQAIDYYQQVLHYYPNDSTAQLGLNMVNQTNLSTSQIKILLDDNPDTAILHFNLGNAYANQGNWAAAQQAYFDAYRLDTTKADYAYNLAVSLEHLRQSKTALNYYQTALSLSHNQAINFSPQQVVTRIKQLEQ